MTRLRIPALEGGSNAYAVHSPQCGATKKKKKRSNTVDDNTNVKTARNFEKDQFETPLQKQVPKGEGG